MARPAAGPLVLASSSPRRLALLRQAAIEPDRVIAPDIDETVGPQELPLRYAERMAQAKLDAARRLLADPASTIIVADTVVACGRRILPKASSAAEADACLRLLSGRRHRVYGAVAVGTSAGQALRVVRTVVKMRQLRPEDIAFYLRSGEWEGKAGGYAIQGLAAMFVESLNGSYTNIVGLPLTETVQMLYGLGWRRGEEA